MRAFVIGDPVGHSLSPVIHAAAYAATALDHQFEAAPVTPAKLGQFMGNLPADLLGLAVTMPHKQAITAYLDQVEPLAQAVGSVNTVIPAGQVLTGFNTDVFGIVESLKDTGMCADSIDSAVIIGSGATAASAVAALGQLHVRELNVIARRFDGSGSISAACARMGVSYQPIPWRDSNGRAAALRRAQVIVSTVPAGVADELAEQFQPAPAAVVLDAAYHPWPSRLAAVAVEGGARVSSGHLMLLHQARQQFALMTGLPAPTEAMREALQRAAHVAVSPLRAELP